MDQEKIDAFNEARAKRQQEEDDKSEQIQAVNNSGEKVADAVRMANERNLKHRANTETKTRVTNPDLAKTQDAKEIVDSINGLNLTTFIAASGGIHGITETLEQLTDKMSAMHSTFRTQGLDSLNKQLDPLVKRLEQVSTQLKATKLEVDSKALGTVQDASNALKKTIESIDWQPTINVVQSDVNVPPLDLKPLLDPLNKVEKAVKGIKIPEYKTDLKPVVDGLKAVQNTIGNLTFPVSNYVLPFKDVNGKATQVQLDSSGNVPISGGGGGGGDASAANQTTQITAEQATQAAVELIDDTVATLGTTTYTEATTKGLTIGAVRRDADTTLVNTTNEVGPVQMDANGRLKVEVFSGETLPVSLATNTPTLQSGSTTAVTQATATNLKAEVIGATSGSGTATGAIRVELPTNGTGVVGLNAGTNAIGKLAANSGIDIGDVDVTSSALPTGAATSANQSTEITALQLIDDPVATLGTTTYTEATTKGNIIGVVRRDANTSLVDTTNEVAPLQVNATGELKVAQIQALPAGTNAIGKLSANTGVTIGAVEIAASQTLATVTNVATIGTSVTPGTGATNLGKAEDAVHASGDVGVAILAVRDDTLNSTSGTEGDYEMVHTTATGALWVTQAPSTSGGWSTAMMTSADGSTALTATAQAIKASAGTFGGYYIYNPNASAIYVHIYNTAFGSVTVGTTNPQCTFCIPATAGANLEIGNGVNFATAMSAAATTTGGGNTAPGTALECVFWFA